MPERRGYDRRSFLMRVTGVAMLGGCVSVVAAGDARAIRSDSDTTDRPAAARCSDRDSGDAVGAGRSCYAPGCTDRDPTDRTGAGHWCGGRVSAPQGQQPSGCTDRDTSDQAGRGHCRPITASPDRRPYSSAH